MSRTSCRSAGWTRCSRWSWPEVEVPGQQYRQLGQYRRVALGIVLERQVEQVLGHVDGDREPVPVVQPVAVGQRRMQPVEEARIPAPSRPGPRLAEARFGAPEPGVP